MKQRSPHVLKMFIHTWTGADWI